jgi:hypothetical protein
VGGGRAPRKGSVPGASVRLGRRAFAAKIRRLAKSLRRPAGGAENRTFHPDSVLRGAAGPSIIRVVKAARKRKAVALQEAIQTTERLLGEEAPSERLASAQQDVKGRGMQDFALSMLVSELTRVVVAQQERIEELEARLSEMATPEEATAE